MSEVLSRGFGTFPADERQSLRFGRFLMAAGTSLLVATALLLLAFLGLNLRFSDPSLTTEQAGAAILLLAYIMYHAGPARPALALFYLMAMLFGVLRLNVARRMGLALAAHGTVLQLTICAIRRWTRALRSPSSAC